jgi:alkylated DNA repair dioxygenase AlkB
MKFTRLSDRAVAELDLPPRSLLVLSDQARYAWAHEIPARLSDWRDGRRQARERRVSVTFRSVNIQTELANQRVFQGAGHV